MRVSVDVYEPQPDILRECGQVLDRHGVIAFPTETFYGLAASARDAVACAHVFEIKGRPATKALPCIIADIGQLEEVAVDLSASARTLAAKFWPGPLTLVVRAAPGVAAAAGDGTVAVRVSALPLARALARIAGPITSTSANPGGSPPATTADAVEAALGSRIPLLLDGGPTPGGLPSTVVDVTTDTPRLIRAGRISFDEISKS